MLTLDLEFLEQPRMIAAALLDAPAGPVLVDPGPASALPALRRQLQAQGFGIGDLNALLLTHVHLDHAGAAGVLARENPRLRIHVHESGAPHLADPSRLIRSAARLYGDAMDRLWGEIAPVPPVRIETLAGGEWVRPGGRRFHVAYTPGHATHHVSYLDDADGVAFVGDTGGLRIANAPCVLPLTPPPDFDLSDWMESLDAIRAWRPDRLFVTHFGAADGVDAHIAELEAGLADWSARVLASLQSATDDDERAARFARDVADALRDRLPDEDVERYMTAAAPEACWHGIARYWRLKAAG